MKKSQMNIGQGWQYTVYDLGDRVRKIPHSREETEQILFSRGRKYKEGELEIIVDNIIRSREESIAGLQKRKINQALLGNPIFLDNEIYLQDKAVPLRDKFSEFRENIKEGHQLINEYTQFIFECWKNGFSERTYNFTINNAYNHRGIILIDLGEIAFSKGSIKNNIEEERWLKSWSFQKELDPKLKRYYKKQMKRSLTLENLEKYWMHCPSRDLNLDHDREIFLVPELQRQVTYN